MVIIDILITIISLLLVVLCGVIGVVELQAGRIYPGICYSVSSLIGTAYLSLLTYKLLTSHISV